ncbi:unnamed protein product, partial [Iphiclides podalirius]
MIVCIRKSGIWPGERVSKQNFGKSAGAWTRLVFVADCTAGRDRSMGRQRQYRARSRPVRTRDAARRDTITRSRQLPTRTDQVRARNITAVRRRLFRRFPRILRLGVFARTTLPGSRGRRVSRLHNNATGGRVENVVRSVKIPPFSLRLGRASTRLPVTASRQVFGQKVPRLSDIAVAEFASKLKPRLTCAAISK